MSRDLLREAAAEFLGTAVLIAFGVGVVAQTVLSASANGSYLGINVGWGLAVVFGVLVAGGVSGAHLNPAVTVALAVHRGLPWRKVPIYAAAQVAGAFVGAALVYVTYGDAFAAFDGGVRLIDGARGTAGIFATYPQPFLSMAGGLVDQMVGTALLMIGVFAIGDTAERRRAGMDGPDARRRPGGRHRCRLRLQRRLCHQSRPRFRPPALHRRCRLGRRRVHGPVRAGGGCRLRDRSSAPFLVARSTTCASPGCGRPRPVDEPLRPGPRSGHDVEPRDRSSIAAGASCRARSRSIAQIFPQPGHVEHDPEDIWRSQLETAREALATRRRHALPTSPRSASPTSARRRCCGSAPAAGRWPTRSSGRAASPRRLCDRLKAAGHEPVVRAKTGLVIDAYFSASKIKHLLDTTDGLARASGPRRGAVRHRRHAS